MELVGPAVDDDVVNGLFQADVVGMEADATAGVLPVAGEGRGFRGVV